MSDNNAIAAAFMAKLDDERKARLDAAAREIEINPLAVPATPVNDFYAIASGPGAVVEPQAEWAGEGGILSNGFPTGIVLQEQYNKAWRQSTAWIRVLGWHASQLLGQNVHDDGNSEKLWRQFYEGLLLHKYVITTNGPNNYTTLNWTNLAWTTPTLDGLEITLWNLNYPNTSNTCTLNYMGTGAYPIVHSDGSLPRPGDISWITSLTFGRWSPTTGFWYINAINMNMLQPRLNEVIAAAGAAITLTGDITGTGISTIPTVLPNVNPNPGTFQGITVNAKGQVTAAVYKPTSLHGDVSGTGDSDYVGTTLASVNLNPGTFQGITADVKGRVTNAVNMNYALNSTLVPNIKANSFGTLVDVLSTPGVFNYTVPANCFLIQAILIGGGGGTAGSAGAANGACAGGGGGGCCISAPIAVSPGQVIGYQVGAGGSAVSYGATGGNGGTTTFAGFYSASGGQGASFAQIGNAGYGANGLFNIGGSPGTPYASGAIGSSGGVGGTSAGPYGAGGGSSGTGLAGPGWFPGGGGGGPGSGGPYPGHPGGNGGIYILR